MIPNDLVSVPHAARVWGFHSDVVRRWIKSGRLPALIPPTGSNYRVSLSALGTVQPRRSPVRSVKGNLTESNRYAAQQAANDASVPTDGSVSSAATVPSKISGDAS